MKVVCVSAVKGGVGKTMISINLAKMLSDRGHSVGLLDADFDNANFSQFTQTSGNLEADPVKGFKLFNWNGIKVFSMSLIAGREKAVSMPAEQYWGLVSDIAHNSNWDVEYLIIDLPGGGGEIFKASVQVFAQDLIGDLIVIQPSMWDAAHRVLNLHKHFEVPVIGLIENMSGMQCLHCGTEYFPFGQPISGQLANEFGVQSFGPVPLDLNMSDKLLKGEPWLEGTGNTTLEMACVQIESMEKVKPGFISRFKAKVMEGVRDEMAKVIGHMLLSVNKTLPVGQLVEQTGFNEARPVLFHIVDDEMTTELMRFAIRVHNGSVKVLKPPYPAVDFEITTSFRTLARMIMGQKMTQTGPKMCDPIDFWLNGDIRLSGEGHAPKATHLFKTIFANPAVMNEVREKHGSTLSRWI